MNKKSLLFLLLMALFAPWAANAQETVTIGNGTSGGSGTPFNTLYGYSFVEQIYSADEITVDGETVAGTITELRFYLNQVYADVAMTHDIVVYMKNVTKSAFSTVADYEHVTSNDIVFEGQWTIPMNTSGWLSIPLDTPFVYDGESNLMVAIDENTSGYKTRNFRYTNTTDNTVVSFHSDSNNPDPYSASLDSFSYSALKKTRADLQLVIIPSAGPSCPKPTNLTVSNLSSNSATVNWESTGTWFHYQYRESGEEWIEDGGYGGTGSTFASLTEVLEPNTTYEFRVQNICNLDPLEESAYATTQFTTPCGAITTFPWTEDFESYDANTIPSCWDNSSSTSSTLASNPERIWGVYSYSNNKMLRMYNYYVQSGTALINTNPITLPGGDAYQLAFDYSHRANCGAFKVKISTDGGTTFTDLQSYTSTGSNNYTDPGTFTTADPIFLTDYAGQTVILQFFAEANYGSGAIFLDNVSIRKVPTCLPPTGLHVAELTAHSVRIEWDAEEGAMFQENFNTLSFDPNTPPTDWGTYTDYDNFAYWDGLAPEHFYGIWVRKYCSADDQSEPIYITFTTPEACPAPTGLHVVEGSITSTGASFSWDAEEGAAFQYFTIEDPWADFVPTDEYWSNSSSSPNNTVGWTNAFTPNSVQRFYLRKDCGDDGYSDYTYVEFRTLCGPMSLADGYSEDFDDYTAVSTGTSAPTGYPNVDLPHCWQFLNLSESSSTYPQAFLSSSTTYAVSGNCLFFKSSSTTPLYAILPDFVQDISEYQLTFTYRNEGTSSSNGTLYVGYMTDPSDASTFVQTLVCEKTTTLTTKTAYFANAPQGSFMAFKYEGGTSNNYYLSIDNVVVSNGPACFPTGTLDCIELSSTTATLSWTLVDFQQNAWVVEYSQSPQFFEPVVSVDANQNWNFVIEGLVPETQYYARVRANCGNGSYGDYGTVVTFTTLDACPVPTNLFASNLTQVSADLSWEASEDVTSYTVKYRRTAQVVGIPEQFNTSSTPSDWEVKTGLLESILNEGGTLTESASPCWSFGTGNGVFDTHAKLNIYGLNCKSWLITPSHTVEGGDAIAFDLALTAYSGSNVPTSATTGTDDRFVVLITDDNGQTWDVLREWNNNDGSQYVYNDIACTATGERVTIPMGAAYMGRTVRFAFYGESTAANADNNLHIDNVVIGTSYAAGAYSEFQSTTTSMQLMGLDANMEYEVIVKSDCSNPEEYSEPITFKTLDESKKVFVGGAISDDDPEGNQWSNANNWVPYGMPSATNDDPDKDVILRHDAVIAGNPNGMVFAFANSITFEGTPKATLTIEDGNQLWLNTNISEQNQVTVKKNIIGYAGTNDLYYLISIPAYKSGSLNAVISGLVTTDSEYDLYDFDPTEELEWRNYKAESFSLYQGEGYLYANAADVELNFTGEIRNNKERYTIFNYDYYPNEEYSLNGWELAGNPFTCNAYLSTNSQTMAFYRMNAEGTGFEAVTSVIKPMEGFFIQNTVRGESVVLRRTAPSKGVRCLNLVLSQVAAHRDGVSTGSTTLDNAIIRFDEGNTLEKISFREGSSKVYMPVEGKDYAVVNAGQMGELPVSFKAGNNGTYTISVNAEEVSFAYLHLIDNMTGVETDLLANPNYSFEAKTTGYESRFKLVFVCGDANNDNDFAFFSNGSFIINNEGNAMLQVIDVTGRIVKSESINGCASVNVNGASGVYMLRLVNGENVKVQKLVVR